MAWFDRPWIVVVDYTTKTPHVRFRGQSEGLAAAALVVGTVYAKSHKSADDAEFLAMARADERRRALGINEEWHRVRGPCGGNTRVPDVYLGGDNFLDWLLSGMHGDGANCGQ